MVGKFSISLLLALLCTLGLSAQSPFRAYTSASKVELDGEELISLDLKPIAVYPKPIDTRKYARLIHNIKVVYPIAQQARMLLDQTEKALVEMKSRGDQKEFVKQMEQDLKEQYTPVLRKMTYSQGRVLLKLIDRQTSHTSYDLVKDLRGSFSAFFWQGVARIFGANLKMEYDAEGEDKEMERLIRLYELGLI